MRKTFFAVPLLAACLLVHAAQQPVNLGTSANSGNGDPLRTAFTKLNANDAELYGKFPSNWLTGTCTTSIPLRGDGSCGTIPSSAITGLAASATTNTTNASNITSGTLGVATGGSGAGTFLSHGLLVGEGTSPFSSVAALAADTLLAGQGIGSDPAGLSLLNCGDSTHALAYSTSTHSFSCQAIVGSGGISTPVSVPNGGTGLASLTNHGLVVGAGTSSVNLVAAMAADTILQGQGASADPAAVSLVDCVDPNHALAYSTTTHAFSCQPLNTLSTPVSVPNGGTGQSALTSHGVLVGENVSGVGSVAAMAADTLLQGKGASLDPAAVSLLNCGDSTHALSYSTSTHTFGCQAISGLSTPVTVANGGTGVATLTNHGVLLGQGTSNVASVTAMAADTFLQGQGASADPSAGSLINCGDSTHALAYSTTSHTFTCQSVTGTGGSAQFSMAAKASDTSRSNTTTLSDDPELQVTSLVAGTYSVEWMVIITGPVGNVNFKAGLDCTATVTSSFWATNIIDAAGNRGSNAGQNACPASQTQTVLTSGAYTIIQGFGTVVQSTTGTIAIQWTQASSSATAEVAKAGSWLRVSKVL